MEALGITRTLLSKHGREFLVVSSSTGLQAETMMRISECSSSMTGVSQTCYTHEMMLTILQATKQPMHFITKQRPVDLPPSTTVF